MNLFIYALSALLTLLMAARGGADPRGADPRSGDPRGAGGSLARLSVLIAGIWLCFAGFLVLDSDVFRLLRGLLSLAVPAALGRFFDALLGDRPRLRRLEVGGRVPAPYVLGAIYLGLSAAALRWGWMRHASEVVLGAAVVALLAVEAAQIRMYQQRLAMPLEQARARNLLVLTLAPMIWIGIEALGRLPGQSQAASGGWLLRAVEVQGAIPPIGAIVATGTLFLMRRAVVRRRMLDLDEILQAIFSAAARTAPLSAAAATLGTLTLLEVGPTLPGRSAVQAALVAVLAVVAADPSRTRVEHLVLERLNQRGQRLREAVAQIRDSLARVIGVEPLAEELLERLVRSGRISTAGLYLWDPAAGTFRLQASRGQPGLAPAGGEAVRSALSRRPLVRPWLQLEARAEQGRPDPQAPPLLHLLDGLDADALLPLMADQAASGWLALRDGDGGGFSEDEIALLQRLADRVAVLLANASDFERLKEVNRLAALGTMAAGLAHEIRNPLAGIKGAAQLLQGGPPDPEMLEVILTEVDRLNTVVTQFLDYARPLQLQREEIRVEALIAQVAALFRAQGLPDVQWIEEHAPDLPPARIDAPRVKQVLLNLCQNAVQAMDRAGTLHLRTRPGALPGPQGQQPCVEISVSDTGCGIAPDDLPRLFVPFFTRRHDGTGLGLAICQRIAQAHGGSIEVSSTPGRGSTFILRLPLGA